jgi:hypothetical protein
MRIERGSVGAMPVTTNRRFAIAAFVAASFALLLGAEPATGAAKAGVAGQGLSDADKVCIGCHESEGSSGKFKNGDTLSLAIDGEAFARSVHGKGKAGCVDCHEDADSPGHPGNMKSFDSARQYALAQNESCRACHGRVYKAYERSVHAVRLREGNAKSPICGDCHPPHEVVPASTAEDGPRDACLTCHGSAAKQHEQWLPNATIHLRSVSCSACHAPAAIPQVELRIHRGAKPLLEGDGGLQFAKRARAADTNGDGLDANELRALLIDLEGKGDEVSLRGRIELRSGVEAHELPGKEKAVRDCVKCHDSGAAAFQNVTVSVVDASGRPIRYAAHKEILGSAITWDALRGFYAIGGTRVKLLDIVLVLGLIGGLAVPALHLAVRRLFRRRPEHDGEPK